MAADDSKCGRGCSAGGIFWVVGGRGYHTGGGGGGQGVMSGRGTYVVLLPVKLQRVLQLSQLGLQIRSLLLLLRQP